MVQVEREHERHHRPRSRTQRTDGAGPSPAPQRVVGPREARVEVDGGRGEVLPRQEEAGHPAAPAGSAGFANVRCRVPVLSERSRV